MSDDSIPAELKRYSAVHANPKGEGDARPTALQIIKDNNLEGKWPDKTILITGCSSGLGVATTVALLATGAHVIATARSLPKLSTALSSFLPSPFPSNLTLLPLELTSLPSIRTFAATFLQTTNHKLNILIGNAGVMALPTHTLTEAGHETQLATNHLGHFLLFQLLKPALLASSSPSFSSRVVSLSSMAHRSGNIPFTDINLLEPGAYTPGGAYANSKLANIHFANAIERRYATQGIHAYSLNPGGIVDGSGLQTHIWDQISQMLKRDDVKCYMKNREQGAATTVWGAVAGVLEGKGGVFLEDCQVCGEWRPEMGMFARGWEKRAFDEESEERLWRVSNVLVGLSEEE
ncbi:NAD(P)-binding protein [Periconia macrospinosa]|uniref:NAD(P)-binding protein n=1 Tax=Periconia macrospinosa TaxID=97972 RepID=A0A2V1DD41_9PLEO|nr:NAD(P)-binding protein [Periconia macrospinosa]